MNAAMTKQQLVDKALALGSEHGRSKLTRMRKLELVSLVGRLEKLQGMTAEEFTKKALNSEIPVAYSCYFASWLDPDGRIHVGKSHQAIAEAIKKAYGADEFGIYRWMSDHGFIRLCPYSSPGSSLDVEMSLATATEAQVKAIEVLLETWTVPVGGAYIGNKKVHSKAEFINAIRAHQPPAYLAA